MKYLTIAMTAAIFSMPVLASEMESAHLDNKAIFTHQADSNTLDTSKNTLAIPEDKNNLKR